MDEIWKDIPKYKGYYQASNFGRIRSVDRISKKGRNVESKILSQKISKRTGYCSVTLGIDGMKKTELVHRLVAMAHLENPSNYDQVNHKDENKLNNFSNNLEWCDKIYNSNYGTRNERSAIKKFKAVNMYTLDMKFIRRFDSLKEAGKYVNGNPCNIAQNCKQLSKSSYGYIWHWCRSTIATDKSGKSYFKGKVTSREE